MKINTYTSKGNKGKSENFPKKWQESGNAKLLAQVMRVYEHVNHPGLSKVKTRGEVSFSTRKIYRQKGTGLARHGDRGAPIFVKGGVAHGPTGKKRRLTLPKKMRKKALKVALTTKAEKGEMFFVDKVVQIKKTKDAASLIDKIANKEKSIRKKSRFTLVLSKENSAVLKALRNLKTVKTVFFKDLNAHKIFFGGILLFDKDVFKSTEKSKKNGTKKTEKKKEKNSKK